MKRILLLLTHISIVLFSISAIAADKVVVIPLGSSSNKIPNNTSACDSSTAGIIRWTGSVFEGCNGMKWILLSPVPTVYSSGHEWMDRNLGASRVATNSTDAEAYGDMYQWGRFADGHEKRNSPKIDIQSDHYVPGHSKFIYGHLDWVSAPNGDLWQGSGINNPCPAGFRLPTETEWDTERASWGSNNAAGAFSSPLKLVMAPYRNYLNGAVTYVGFGAGHYWSSTVMAGSSAFFLSFYSNGADMTGKSRAYGHSVRCLKD